jgi:hypothetical protein
MAKSTDAEKTKRVTILVITNPQADAGAIVYVRTPLLSINRNLNKSRTKLKPPLQVLLG